MKHRILFSLSILSVLSLISCNYESKNNEIPTIDLYGQIDTSSCNHLDQSAWNVKEINLNLTDSTIFSNIEIDKVEGDDVWVNDYKGVYHFSAATGNCTSILSKRGQGPDEYQSILCARILASGNIAINDFNTKNILLYHPDGNFITRNKKEFGDLVATGNDITTLSFPGYCKAGAMAYKLNSDLVATDSLLLGRDRETTKGFLHMLPLYEMNGKPYLQFQDTIFSLEDMSNKKPLVSLYTGALHIPEEVEDDFKRTSEWSNYINSLFATIWKSLIFIKYSYGENTYYDIWDIDKEKLIYRSKGTFATVDKGFPIKLSDGSEVFVWPQYSDENSLIGLIPAETDSPTDDEQNPRIFVISQK